MYRCLCAETSGLVSPGIRGEVDIMTRYPPKGLGITPPNALEWDEEEEAVSFPPREEEA